MTRKELKTMTQEELYSMPLHSTASAKGYEIMRVESGWLYKWEVTQYDSLVGDDIIVAVSVTFVPEYPEVATAQGMWNSVDPIQNRGKR